MQNLFLTIHVEEAITNQSNRTAPDRAGFPVITGKCRLPLRVCPVSRSATLKVCNNVPFLNPAQIVRFLTLT